MSLDLAYNALNDIFTTFSHTRMNPLLGRKATKRRLTHKCNVKTSKMLNETNTIAIRKWLARMRSMKQSNVYLE